MYALLVILSTCTSLIIVQGFSTIDTDMTGCAGRPSVYRLPPDLLARAFSFLPELEVSPLAMSRTALNVTHVCRWFRAVGIHLQPRLWTRLPLHSLDLVTLFYNRSGHHPIEIICAGDVCWRNPRLEDILFALLNPTIIPRIQVLELVASSYDSMCSDSAWPA